MFLGRAAIFTAIYGQVPLTQTITELQSGLNRRARRGVNEKRNTMNNVYVILKSQLYVK